MNTKNKNELQKMAKSGAILAHILREIKKNIKPGVSGEYLDILAEQLIIEQNAEPAFKGYGGYPYTICISINDEIVHGLPLKNKIIKEGDIVGIDCGVKYNGWCSDAAFTVGVGSISDDAKKVMEITKKSLDLAIPKIKSGIKISEIQNTIQSTLESNGLGVIKSLSGHGIGKSVHESPSIPNYVNKNNDFTLEEGMVICIEPMASLGTEKIKIEPDGWGIKTCDGSLAAHFEHTIEVTKTGYKILTK